MAYQLPDGATVNIGTAFGTPIAVTGISNANPAVVSATAHGLTNGTLVTVKSGWNRINDRVFRVANAAANTFQLEGVDTTDTTQYPVGGGAGSVIPDTTFMQVAQVISFDVSGGDPQFTTVSFLEDNFDRQLFTTFSATSIAMTIAFDPAGPGYLAALAASRSRSFRPVTLNLPNGARVLYYGQINVNESPTVAKGQVMQTRINISLSGLPVIYLS